MACFVFYATLETINFSGVNFYIDIRRYFRYLYQFSFCLIESMLHDCGGCVTLNLNFLNRLEFQTFLIFANPTKTLNE